MINRPASMTTLFYIYEEGKHNLSDGLRLMHEAGFDVLDLCMCPMQRWECELCDDENWEKYTDMIGNEAAKYGMTFAQSHPPYPIGQGKNLVQTDNGQRNNEFFLKMMKRALEIDSRLGIPWAVMHPVGCAGGSDCVRSEAEAQLNYDYYMPLLELCEKNGVGFAFENMFNTDAGQRRFGSQVDDLLMIYDKFKGHKVGFCWDTGHANKMYQNQIPALSAIADKLVCTHIDDNKGDKDSHLLPFMGTVNWEGVVKTLKAANYQGAFSYEVASFKPLPMELRMDLAKYAAKLSQYLIDLE